uniref:Similar to Linear gramicidin synthase subunit D acc. no. Q70LM4 n=1 Tax=Pyronema omphalodes (strain CBS 100304) TaxID=1076935 RepID=U4LLH7_PYROM
MAIHTIDELLRDTAAKHPDATILSYFSDVTKSETYSASDLNLMSQRCALWYSKVLPKIRKSSDDAPLVVAILGPTNVEYIATYLALQRLGITVLFLSTRLAPPAYLHLFQKTKSNVVIAQPAFQTVMSQTKELMNGDLTVIPMLDHSYITTPNADDSSSLPCSIDPAKEYNRLGWIIHSSGSTGLPKPVGHFQKTAQGILASWKFSFKAMVTVPLFHTFGLHGFLKAIHTAKTCSILSADLPITGANLMQCVITNRPEIMFTVPYLIKLMAETDGSIPELAKLNRILYSGASCPQVLGDKLISGGATMISCMGSTEVGPVMMSSNGKEGWNWLIPTENAGPHLVWEEEDGGLFQMIVKGSWKALVAENRFDGSYATGDLFQKHPTKPMHFKYIGRRDDTIVMMNGEKANPIPLENAMRRNKLVDEAIAFGQGKATLGLIVIPSEQTRGMSTTQVVDAIMESVEEGNALVPAYARIYRDAIIVKPIGTWFRKTDKGTAIRAAFISNFTPDIEAYYEKLELDESSTGEALSEAEIRKLIRDTVLHSLQLKDTSILRDDTDFFSLGLDSLMAISIRRKLAQEINTNGQVLSSNVVFEKPNINALAAHLVSLSTGAITEQKESVEEVMTGLIEKYTNFQTHRPSGVIVEGEYVVLTGATGSIGSHILFTLLQRAEVKVVYCLVRASSLENASERVNSALSKAHLLESLSTEQRAKILALPSDLSDEHLGLPTRTYRSVLSRATAVIHNAWGVNFNMDVTSFEGQHIRGSSNLINFCLASPQNRIPSFNFISSVSTAMGRPEKTVPEVLPEFAHAMPMGYAHSKMVVEYICDAAAKKTGITARILRVGQVVGDTKHGMWNATEAVPLTVQAAVTVGALPVVPGDESVSWLPVDTTAAAVVDLSLQEKKESRVFNVCHPGLLKWNKDFLPALKKAGLKFEAVDGAEWVKRLESEQDPTKNPPIKLLDFFRMRYSGQATAEPYFETKASCKNSKSLRTVQNVDQDLVAKFVKHWKEECW